MTTQTLERKVNGELKMLRRDIEGMKKILFAGYSDPEGEYQPAFIKKMLERMASQGPTHRFTTKEDFLRHVRSKK